MESYVLDTNGNIKRINATAPATSETTITATGNIDDLDFSNASVIRMNNATDATLRGLKAGTAGQQVIIQSVGAGNVFLSNQNTNSSAANRLINSITTVDTPLAHGLGYASYEYDATTARWRISTHMQGGAFAYTPVWTGSVADPTLGNGSLTGTYQIVNGINVIVTITLTIGSTTTLGTGFWKFTVPIAAMGAIHLGTAYAQVFATGANYAGLVVFVDSTHVETVSTASTNLFGAAQPFAWTTSDNYNAFAIYQGT